MDAYYGLLPRSTRPADYVQDYKTDERGKAVEPLMNEWMNEPESPRK
jgi:hypothetical protein